MQRTAVLVDFDNCRNDRLDRAIGLGNPSLADYQSVFDELISSTVSKLRTPTSRSEFYFRFYGGWFESTTNDPTDLHNMIVQCVANHPRHLNRQRLTFEIAYAPIFRGDLRLEATLRTEPWSRPEGRVNALAKCMLPGSTSQCQQLAALNSWLRGKCPQSSCAGRLKHIASRRGQKMVDTLIVADTVIAGLSGDFDHVVVCSADDDLIPGLLFQGTTKCSYSLARLNFGSENGRYDLLLDSQGIAIHEL